MSEPTASIPLRSIKKPYTAAAIAGQFGRNEEKEKPKTEDIK